MQFHDHDTLIGLVGHPSCGKDTVAAFMVDTYKFVHVSTGDLVRFYIAEHDLGDAVRDLEKNTGNFLRSEHGADYFSRLALETQARHLVVSGLRTVAEVTTLQEAGATIITCTAPIRSRYARARERGRVGGHITFEVFEAQEKAEAANENPASQNVAAVIAMADYMLDNQGTLEDLHQHITHILRQMKFAHA